MKIPGDVSPRVRKELTTYFRNNINQHLSQDCRFAVSRENQVRPWKTINKGLGSWGGVPISRGRSGADTEGRGSRITPTRSPVNYS